VSVEVVDLLEVVDVNEHQRQGGFVSRSEGELARELILEPAMVAQAGQGVLQRVHPGSPVEVLQPHALFVEGANLGHDPARGTCHRHRQDDSGGDEHAQGELPAEPRARPEALDRRDGHDQGERKQQRPGQVAPDLIEPSPGRRAPLSGRRTLHASSLRPSGVQVVSYAAPDRRVVRQQYRWGHPFGPMTADRARATVGVYACRGRGVHACQLGRG